MQPTQPHAPRTGQPGLPCPSTRDPAVAPSTPSNELLSQALLTGATHRPKLPVTG